MKYGDLVTVTELIEELKEYTYDILQWHHTWRPDYSNFTGSNHKSLQDGMRKYHVNTRGWSDIGQHATLFPDGMFMVGRDFGRTPAGITGHNTGAFMFEMLGNFDIDGDKITDKQWQSAIELTRYMRSVGAEYVFHRDYATKTCPGSAITKEMIESELNDVKDLDSYVTWRELYEILGMDIPKEEVLNPKYSYEVISTTHVVKVDPLDLKLVVADHQGVNIKENMINASFVWWTNAAHTDPFPTSLLVYDGKIFNNRQPNGYSWQPGPNYANGAPMPTVIIYKDGTVKLRTLDSVVDPSKVHLAVSGVGALPFTKQGFEPHVTWSSVAYATNRVGIGYDGKQIVLVYRPDTTVERLTSTFKNLGCEFGISLDSGGSANFRVDGKAVNTTTRWMASYITW